MGRHHHPGLSHRLLAPHAWAFTFTPGTKAAQQPTLLDSVCLSLVTVATLGLGDIAPAEGWLRLVSPLEALVGFTLLTATVSWVLEIYPALTRRRVLAIRLALLHRSDPSVQQLDCAVAALLLESLAIEVARVRIDFTQNAEAYYFHEVRTTRPWRPRSATPLPSPSAGRPPGGRMCV